jgi:adenylate kinase
MPIKGEATMNALIFGAPGSGKGTAASRLQSKLGVEVICMGDILRAIIKENSPLGIKVKSYVEKGMLAPDEIVIEVLQENLSKLPAGRGFILDGFPRTVAQAEALEKVVKIDVIMMLDVPASIIVERLSARRTCKNCGEVYNTKFLKPKVENICDKCGGPLIQRADDNPEVIKNRLEVYEKQTSPLIKYYESKNLPFIVHKVDNVNAPPEVAVEYMLSELKKLNMS